MTWRASDCKRCDGPRPGASAPDGNCDACARVDRVLARIALERRAAFREWAEALGIPVGDISR